MPKVISMHGMINDNYYGYSEGLFYTIGTIPMDIKQINIPSSGFNVGVFKTEEAYLTIKKDMKKLLSNQYDYVIIHIDRVEENDYHYCYSGPSIGSKENINSTLYSLSDGKIVCTNGIDIFKTCCETQ